MRDIGLVLIMGSACSSRQTHRDKDSISTRSEEYVYKMNVCRCVEGVVEGCVCLL